MNIPLEPMYNSHFKLQPAQAVPVLRNHPKLKGVQLPDRHIENLPFPLIGSLVRKLSKNLGTPYDMTLHSTLAAAAVCVQGKSDVHVPGGWESPTSAMFLLAAPSAAGKTPLERQLFHVLDEMEDELLKKNYQTISTLMI